MHLKPYLFFLIYDQLYSVCLADIFLFPLIIPITFEIVHTCVSLQNTNGHEVLSDSHKYYTFKPYWSFHDYEPFSIHSLAVIIVFVCKYL